jgi:glycosyltransferase involved in cell wall biosynthesis
MKNKVILQILPKLNTGGVERGTIEIAQAIIKSDNKSIVVSNGGEMVKQLEAIGSLHIQLSVHRKNPFSLIRNIKKLRSIIIKHKVDIVHARSRIPAWVAYFACRDTNAKFITTFHGVYSFKTPLKKLYNSVMTKGEKIISISNFITEHILTNYHITPEKIIRIYRGIDLDIFNVKTISKAKEDEFHKKYTIPKNRKIILMPCRITGWKGHKYLLRALKQIKSEQFFCLIVGSDKNHRKYRQELEKMIKKFGLQDKAAIFQNCGELHNLYKFVDIVVSPSQRPEAFGRVMAEASACGKPVVATNHGGSCENIRDGETGFLVSPTQPSEMAEKIKKLLQMPEKDFNKMSKAGAKYISDNFSLKLMQKHTINLYKELLND